MKIQSQIYSKLGNSLILIGFLILLSLIGLFQSCKGAKDKESQELNSKLAHDNTIINSEYQELEGEAYSSDPDELHQNRNYKIADTCVKCDIEIVSSFYQMLLKDNIQMIDCDVFLCTIDKSCKNNVEYSEFANRTLFLLLELRPIFVIDFLSRQDPSDDAILEMLSQPIGDDIDIRRILDQLKKVDRYIDIRDRIIKSIPNQN